MSFLLTYYVFHILLVIPFLHLSSQWKCGDNGLCWKPDVAFWQSLPNTGFRMNLVGRIYGIYRSLLGKQNFWCWLELHLLRCWTSKDRQEKKQKKWGLCQGGFVSETSVGTGFHPKSLKWLLILSISICDIPIAWILEAENLIFLVLINHPWWLGCFKLGMKLYLILL